MRIYQGESVVARENELLGEFLFSGISPAPAGQAQVELTFHINIEGILSMSALDMVTGNRMETSVQIKAK